MEKDKRPVSELATPPSEETLLTAEDLANYLKMNVRTILKLAAEGSLPGLKIGNQWRFKRSLVDAWLESQMLRRVRLLPEGEGEGDGPLDGWSLLDLLTEEGIISNLQALERIGVIQELSGRAYQGGFVADRTGLVGALLERENLLSTALEGGIALLHARSRPAVPARRSFLLLGRSVVGLDFQAPDGKKTHLFFLLGLRTDRLHLASLARLRRLFREADLKDHILAAASAGEIRGILGAAEARLAGTP